jgi:pyruvate kinase
MRDARSGGVSAADAISSVACRLSDDVNAKAIIVPLEQAAVAFQMGRYRPRAPILALTESSHLAQQLAVGWDIYSLVIPDDTTAIVPIARRWLFRKKLAKKGDHAVVVFASSKVSDQIRDALQVVRL